MERKIKYKGLRIYSLHWEQEPTRVIIQLSHRQTSSSFECSWVSDVRRDKPERVQIWYNRRRQPTSRQSWMKSFTEIIQKLQERNKLEYP